MTRAPDTVGEVMTTDVVTVAPDASVQEAVRAMVEHDIGSVVVVSGDQAVGIFTERDLLRGIASGMAVLERGMGDVMSTELYTTEPGAQVVDAFELMTANEVRRLPVVQDGRLVGIVTERDLLRWVRDVAEE